MKSIKFVVTALSVFLTLITAVSAKAQSDSLKMFPLSQCPAIGEEYGNLIAKLDAIKSSIKEGANCGNVALKVKSLEDLLIQDRARLLEIVDAGNEGPLTPEQTEFVKNYAEEVTKKVTSLYDLFSQSNQCFRDDSATQGLTTLASFVGEASRVAAGLSGPWGTPIALAGHVVAGFLTGLDQFIKTRAGYNFSETGDWKNYVQNLCTFHSYKEQIAHLLDPKGRLKQLKDLKQKLDLQIERLANSCEECEKIKKDHLTLGQPSHEDITRADERFAKPYGTFMAFNLGIRDWVAKEIARVEKESRSYWADVSGRHLLSSARTSIEQFLVQRESPRFITYQTRRAMEDYGNFEAFALREGRQVYSELYKTSPDVVTYVGSYFVSARQYIDALLIQPIRWNFVPNERQEDLRYAWTHFRDQGLTHLRNAESSLEVVLGFCSFFKQAGYYNAGIRRACTAAGVNQLSDKMSTLDGELARAGIRLTSPLKTQAPDDELKTPASRLDSLELFVDQLSRP